LLEEIKRNVFLKGRKVQKHAQCPRQFLGYKSGEGLHLCIAGHAERNAIVNAARYGIAVKGAQMYMNCPVPCTPCLIEIINAGISEVIVTELKYYDEMAEQLVKWSKLNVRIYEGEEEWTS
jgi:dCMP deaminase